MSASTEAPVTITPEAESYIAELGKRTAVEEMIAFLRRMPPAHAAIRVQLEPAYDSDEPTILLIAVEKDGNLDPETRRQPWWDWVVVTFPMEEMMNIAIDFKRPEGERF